MAQLTYEKKITGLVVIDPYNDWGVSPATRKFRGAVTSTRVVSMGITPSDFHKGVSTV